MFVIKFLVPSTRTTSGIEVFRWSLKDKKREYDFDKIKAKLCNYYNNPEADFLLSWFDGSDECSIISNADLNDLYEHSQKEDKKCNEVRINVKVIESIDEPRPSNKEPLVEELTTDMPNDLDTQEGFELVEQGDIDERDTQVAVEPQQEKNQDDLPNTNQSPANDHPNTTLAPTAPQPTQAPVVNPTVFYPNNIPWVGVGQMPNQMNPMIPYPMPPMYFAPPVDGQWPQYQCQPFVVPNLPTPATTTNQQPQEPNEATGQHCPKPDSLDKSERSESQLVDQPCALAKPIGTTPKSSKKCHKKAHCKGSSEKQESLDQLVDQLRNMGYEQDDKTLKKLIYKNHGDINKVLDKLR